MAQYRRARQLAGDLIDKVEEEFGVPPYMMYAVGSRETWSAWAPNGDPVGYYLSHTGDNGNGHGWFQIDKRYHVIPPDWRNNIEWQTRKGAEVLQSMYRKCRTWEGALNAYNSGTCGGPTTPPPYGPDVMARRAALERLLGPKSKPTQRKKVPKMFLFWHQGAVYLAVPPLRSPGGLGGPDVDTLKNAGVPLLGKPDDNSGWIHMASW